MIQLLLLSIVLILFTILIAYRKRKLKYEDAMKVLLDEIASNAEFPEMMEKTIDILLALGYDGCLTGGQGITALMYTVKFNLHKLTEHLLLLLSDIDINDHIFSKPVGMKTDVGNNIFGEKYVNSNLLRMVNKRDPNGKTALYYAITNKRYDIAVTLLLHGADVSSVDPQKQVDLLLYCISNTNVDVYPIVGLLAIKLPKAFLIHLDKNIGYFLNFCYHGHTKVIHSLIGSAPKYQGEKIFAGTGCSIFYVITKVNNNGLTLTDDDRLEILKYLFQQADTKNVLYSENITDTLTISAYRGHIRTFKYFANQGDKKQFYKHIRNAMYKHQMELTKYIWKNFREWTVDESGKTALDFARDKNYPQEVNYLLANGAKDFQPKIVQLTSNIHNVRRQL